MRNWLSQSFFVHKNGWLASLVARENYRLHFRVFSPGSPWDSGGRGIGGWILFRTLALQLRQAAALFTSHHVKARRHSFIELSAGGLPRAESSGYAFGYGSSGQKDFFSLTV